MNNTVVADTSLEYLVLNYNSNILAGVAEIYYFLIMLTAVIGTIVQAKNEGINISVEILGLIVFGYFCMIILSEAQSRYKCLIMPYVRIFSSIGFCILMKKFDKASHAREV